MKGMILQFIVVASGVSSFVERKIIYRASSQKLVFDFKYYYFT